MVSEGTEGKSKTSVSSQDGKKASRFTRLESQKTVHETSLQALDNR